MPKSATTTPAPTSLATDRDVHGVEGTVPPGGPARLVAPVTSTEKLIDVPSGSVQIDGKRFSLDAFAIDRTEVTVAAYARCVAEKKCSPAEQDDLACNWQKRKTKAGHPINCVTIKQAKQYCGQNGQRLPTVAEWQLAAGGSEGRYYPWGAAHPSNMWVVELAESEEYAPGPARHNLCWVGDNTAEGEKYPTATCEVGSFPAGNTPSGISDLAGNVAEWTDTAVKQPHGTVEYLVKGGSYKFDPLGRLRVAVEDAEGHDDQHQACDVGFRCVTARAAVPPPP